MFDDRIEDAIQAVFKYAGHIDSWIVIKKEILKQLSHDDRTAFSTRHPITKKQQTNDFERTIAQRWEELSGRKILFSSDEISSGSQSTT